ncbi:MAG: tRNA (adenosine(37)-N6)-threonylcarbamoyltransferase complex ATPase subunit type 1 TsaE [Desulfovibrio sp.]|nr:tRNA (adenosine(37)-N6)-threonylcarbamoyltransferase complex ATPase subunit type 1 TsaE [Desulfovibrio sp.]
MATLLLSSPEATERFGHWLAVQLSDIDLSAILLRGDLGSGKTSLTRALVMALPGSDTAEIGSPSFTLCNHYPTIPPVLHCDLYRCQGDMPDDLLDVLDSSGTLCIVEWAEYLPLADRPQDFLDICFKTCDEGRLLLLAASGPHAARLMERLCADWPCGSVLRQESSTEW